MKDIKFIEQEIKRHFYKKLQYNILIPISQTEVNVAYDITTDALLVCLRVFLASKETVEDSKISFTDVPRDWTDGFKSRFFPTWLVKLFPIQYKKIKVTTVNKITRVCPHINLPDQYNTHFEWLEYGKVEALPSARFN